MWWQQAVNAVSEALEKHRAVLEPSVVHCIAAAVHASQTQLDSGDDSGLFEASQKCNRHTLWGWVYPDPRHQTLHRQVVQAAFLLSKPLHPHFTERTRHDLVMLALQNEGL